MKRLMLLVLVAGSMTFGWSQTTKTAKIEEIFRLTKMDQMQKQMMSQMSAMVKQQMPEGSKAPTDGIQRIMDFVSAKMSWDAMKADYIQLYDETYTEDEISGILLFYESAPGKAFLAKSPVLVTNSIALVQKRMAEIKPEMDQLIKQGVH